MSIGDIRPFILSNDAANQDTLGLCRLVGTECAVIGLGWYAEGGPGGCLER